MQKLQSVLKIIDKVTDKTGKMFSFLIVPMIAVVVYEVVMRYAFEAPTVWAYETTQFIFGTYIILAGGYCLLHRAHINVDVVYRRFPPKVRNIVDLFTSWLLFFFVVILLWKGGDFAWRSVQTLQTSFSMWNPPVYPAKLMLPIGAFLLLLQGLAKFSRDLITVINKHKSS